MLFRSRRLLVVLGGVLVIMVGVFLRGRGGGSAGGVPEVVIPTPSVTPASPSPAASPTFVVPVGARDPFGNS